MKKFLFAFAALLSFCQVLEAARLRVATYNLRNENAGDDAAGNGWAERRQVVIDLVRFHDFEIFGTQEAKYGQIRDLEKGLRGYARIGSGRDDGRSGGEFSAIFFKKEKFKLLESGDFWISPVTDKPNKGWDASHVRICSWGKFADNASGTVFYFFNLHMDHKGKKARAEGGVLVNEQIKKIAGSSPSILTGDFNFNESHEGYEAIVRSGVLKNARTLSPVRYETNGTFNSFNPNAYRPERIDHIFVTKEFSVLRYGILTDSYRSKEEDGKYVARLPSDHFPVVVDVELADAK